MCTNFRGFNLHGDACPRDLVSNEFFSVYGMYYYTLLRMNLVSTIPIREVSVIGRVLMYYVNSPSIGTASSVHYMEVYTDGRCPFKGGSTVIAISVFH